MLQREISGFQLQLVGFDLRDIENLVDDRQQVVRGIGDFGKAHALFRFGSVAFDQMGQADDGIHRRADLVTHVGEEGALGAAGRFGCFLGGRQLGSARVDKLLEVLTVQVEFGSRQLLFGDIGPDRTDQHPAADVDCRCGNPGVLQGAVFLSMFVFKNCRAIRQHAGNRRPYIGFAQLRLNIDQSQCHEFITGVAKAISAGCIDINERQGLRVAEADTVVSIADDRMVDGLFFVKCPFHPLACREIKDIDDQMRDSIHVHDFGGQAHLAAMAVTANADALEVDDPAFAPDGVHHHLAIGFAAPQAGLQGRFAEQVVAGPSVLVEQSLVDVNDLAIGQAGNAGSDRCSAESGGQAGLQL